MFVMISEAKIFNTIEMLMIVNTNIEKGEPGKLWGTVPQRKEAYMEHVQKTLFLYIPLMFSDKCAMMQATYALNA